VRQVLDEWKRATESPDGSEFDRLVEEAQAYFSGGIPL
jgi:hypothetical protein